jgi:hypothetical protein
MFPLERAFKRWLEFRFGTVHQILGSDAAKARVDIMWEQFYQMFLEEAELEQQRDGYGEDEVDNTEG